MIAAPRGERFELADAGHVGIAMQDPVRAATSSSAAQPVLTMAMLRAERGPTPGGPHAPAELTNVQAEHR